ncbi:FtsK/SpoIIIE domain-containing protein [Candidatus Chloroploca asiatica]|uniref:FtsK domain-containing protein n=1 Tax=Candidatus Chloroploca asiatica TaxID=1506545 RepID=A0A2H3KFR9_9CHLR|nr:FtsK/SpoIIIE domain-containing protein [Candidatus Chloroploca asiatica]PDV96519.1 hypothetical protein A9Q02_20725 [Candidatus Chloroploca asiatica]
MQPSFLDALGLFQWLGFAVLVAAWPVYELLTLRRRARQAEERAAQLTQDYQHRIEALDVVQRQAVAHLLQHPQPLRTPPAGVGPTLHAVAVDHAPDPYAIPIGWQNSDGVADLVTGSLHGDSPYFVGNIQVTGMTRWGKNIWEFLTTTTLCARTTPAQVQIFCIDGKGPDGALWRGLAHNWREPITREEDLPDAIAALEALRAERMRLLAQHGVTKWEELPPQSRPPLVWVVINELSLLEKVLGRELERWLTRELSSALAGGLRYCILMQDASNWETGWRRQIGLAVAGGQVSRDADKPNLGMSTGEIKERGGMPPSELAERGQFTVRFYRDVVSVSIPYLTVEERKAAIARLPSARQRTSVSSLSAPQQEATIPDTAVRSAASRGQQCAKTTRSALLADGSMVSTGHQNGVSTDTANTLDPLGTAIDTALEQGDELTDAQITYLHLHRQWSPTRIAESRGLRGRKQVRLERVYAALGRRREPAEVEQQV